jgi:hypothetical protein
MCTPVELSSIRGSPFIVLADTALWICSIESMILSRQLVKSYTHSLAAASSPTSDMLADPAMPRQITLPSTSASTEAVLVPPA